MTLRVFTAEDFLDSPWTSLPPHAHKFDRGHILVIGGSSGKIGAPLMCGLAALRAGAGWVSVSIPAQDRMTYTNLPLELTYEDFYDGRHIDMGSVSAFAKQRRVSAIVIGPGTMHQPLRSEDLGALAHLSHDGVLVLLDAAATQHVLTLWPLGVKAHSERFLLTPHPGEWTRLPLSPLNEVDDFRAAQTKISEYGITVIHKGAVPMVIDSAGSFSTSSFNTNAIAKAGSGDIFAGICAAIAKNYPSLAYGIHASFYVLSQCVKYLSAQRNPHSLLPTDLVDAIGRIPYFGSGDPK